MRNKILILLFISIICLSGCGTKDKYEGYEHYDLKDYDYEIYSYTRNPKGSWNELDIENYAVAFLIPRNNKNESMAYDEGLFYEISENQFILIDKFSGDINSYNNPKYTLLYKDKIYIVRGLSIYEYTLNRENTSKRKLEFNYDAILEEYNDTEHLYYVSGHKIDKVDDEYIYFSNISIHNSNVHDINVQCSLKDYKCVEVK